MYSLDVISSVILLAFTKCSPNTSPNTHHTKTQRVSLSYSLSTLLKGETRELFDKITQWKEHQRTAILVLCLRVLAISLVDYESWDSGRHTPPGGVGGDLLCRLGSLAQECCCSLWSSARRRKSNEQPLAISAGLLNESRAKATLWATRQIQKPVSIVQSLLNPKWWRETTPENIRGKVKKPDNVCICCCHKHLLKHPTLVCYYFIIPCYSSRIGQGGSTYVSLFCYCTEQTLIAF